MDKKIGRIGEQRPGTVMNIIYINKMFITGTGDRKIDNKTIWRKLYREKERCQIQKGLENN